MTLLFLGNTWARCSTVQSLFCFPEDITSDVTSWVQYWWRTHLWLYLGPLLCAVQFPHCSARTRAWEELNKYTSQSQENLAGPTQLWFGEKYPFSSNLNKLYIDARRGMMLPSVAQMAVSPQSQINGWCFNGRKWFVFGIYSSHDPFQGHAKENTRLSVLLKVVFLSQATARIKRVN